MTAYRDLLPVFVLTGYLGSGKTTLLNALLRDPALADAAVLINEFGDVGLDHELVVSVDREIVLLASGCVCCAIREDLKEALLALHARRERGEVPRFGRVLVETTGLADPAPIAGTLMSDRQLRHHFRLAGIVATVDALCGPVQLDRQAETLRQVLAADRLVVTKSDLVTPAATAALGARLARLNGAAELLVAVSGDVAADRILSSDLHADRHLDESRDPFAPVGPLVPLADPPHAEGLHSFTLRFDTPLDWTAFGVWLTLLLHTHGERVLRVKGLLNVRGVETPVVVNGVQHVVHPPFHLAAWPGEDRRSRIVFIVRDLTRDQIERSLAVFNRLGAGV